MVSALPSTLTSVNFAIDFNNSIMDQDTARLHEPQTASGAVRTEDGQDIHASLHVPGSFSELPAELAERILMNLHPVQILGAKLVRTLLVRISY